MADADGGPDDHSGWIKTNQGVAACLAGAAVLLIVYLATSDWAGERLRDGFRLGFFSIVAAIAMLVCAVAMMLDRRRAETEADIARTRWSDWAIVVGALALCYVYFELAWRVDFLAVTPVFVAAATFALGVRPVRSAIVAGVVLTLVIYGLFRAIGIELPTQIV